MYVISRAEVTRTPNPRTSVSYVILLPRVVSAEVVELLFLQ